MAAQAASGLSAACHGRRLARACAQAGLLLRGGPGVRGVDCAWHSWSFVPSGCLPQCASRKGVKWGLAAVCLQRCLGTSAFWGALRGDPGAQHHGPASRPGPPSSLRGSGRLAGASRLARPDRRVRSSFRCCVPSCPQTGLRLRSTRCPGTWTSSRSRLPHSSPSSRPACRRVSAGRGAAHPGRFFWGRLGSMISEQIGFCVECACVCVYVCVHIVLERAHISWNVALTAAVCAGGWVGVGAEGSGVGAGPQASALPSQCPARPPACPQELLESVDRNC